MLNLNNIYIIIKSKNRKNGENTGIYSKFYRPKTFVLGNIIRKPYAKFQVAYRWKYSGNIRKSNGNMANSKNWKNGENKLYF